MKKLPILILPLLCMSKIVFATNGDNMIGVGAISNAMGGTGIANPLASESILKNPALLAPEDNFEMNFAGTYFSPNVKVQNNMA